MPDFPPWFRGTYLPAEGFRMAGTNIDTIHEGGGYRCAMRLEEYMDTNGAELGFSTTQLLGLSLVTEARGHNAYRAGIPPSYPLGWQSLSKQTVSALGIAAT